MERRGKIWVYVSLAGTLPANPPSAAKEGFEAGTVPAFRAWRRDKSHALIMQLNSVGKFGVEEVGEFLLFFTYLVIFS